jgi:hypothetical protein
MRTNYEEIRDSILNNPEMKANYIFASEKLNLELLLDSVRDSVVKGRQPETILRKINKMSDYINKLAL